MPRPLDEIAGDIAGLLGDRGDKGAIAEITQKLDAVRRIYLGGGDLPKAGELKADITAERLSLQKLKKKWHRISGVVTCLNEADQWLAVLSKVNGPDPHYRWFDDVCAILAHDMLRSRKKRLGERLRELAGYLYEAATGIPDRMLETACRRVTQRKTKETGLPSVFERDERGVGRYVWEKKEAGEKK
jgi:hypothetical protein